MNNEFTYWTVQTHLKLWFMSRGWDVLADWNTIMDYINLTIQDIYNQDSATFLHITEELTWQMEWNNKVFKTTFPMRKVQRLNEIDNYGNISCNNMTPTLFSIMNRDEFRFEENNIITDKDIDKIAVTYIKDYEFAKYPEDLWKPVPLPKRYLPALLKLSYDWASPINLMDWEMQNTDFYSHWKTRMNELAQMDWLTDFIDVAPRVRK